MFSRALYGPLHHTIHTMHTISVSLGFDYLWRLILVTTVPIVVVAIFISPWIATFFYMEQRRSKVFDAAVNSVMWIIYLVYPLLCLMTIQGFQVCQASPPSVHP